MKRILLFLFLLLSNIIFSQNKNQSIGFKENKGQIIDQKGKPNSAVKYLLNTGGLNVQLRKNGFSYDIYEVKKTPIVRQQTSKTLPYQIPEKDHEKPEYNLEYIFHRIDIDFINSNSKVELITDKASGDFDNYYNIPNKPEGIVGVHQFKQITYKNIYPNIDVVFTIPADPKKTVEYNFVIHPKGKISDIKLKFDGAETDLVDNKIQMNVRFGKMEETLPASWIEDGTAKKEIEVGYRKIKNNVYGFEAANHDSDKTLIIDPVPTRLWGTYYGGEGFDYSTSVCVKNDFIYWAGITTSNFNIASSGASQINLGSLNGYDSFFTKLNSNGTRVYTTYYGGTREDEISKIVVSDANNIFIAGSSISVSNVATPGSHQDTKGNYWDGFLVKFDKDGIRKWGTYYGGLDNDNIRTLVVDSNEKIYISGETFSKDNIATSSSHQPNFNSISNTTDAFIAKFDTNGIREWGTFYGGDQSDAIFDSKLDSNGNIIFVGYTYSFNSIATPNSYQDAKVNSDQDSFLAKFDINGNQIWGTYFGGNKDDFFFSLGIDSSDNLYCFGKTKSNTGISTAGVYQENFISNSIQQDGCIIKFNSQGFKIWGSYFFPESFGGSVSKNGSIYFTGRVEPGFSSTPNAYQEFPLNSTPGTDSYLVKFTTDGQRKWATYFSGEATDNAQTTALDKDNNIYLAGLTNSKSNIATPGTHQTNLYPDTNNLTPNIGDAFLVKFQDCESNLLLTSNSPVCIDKTLELKASGGTTYAWTGPNGFTSTDQNPIITNVTIVNSGEYSCLITGTGGCDDTKKITVIIGDVESPISDLTTLPTITGDCNTIITTIPTATDACAGAITGTTTNPLSYALPGTYTIIWDYNDGNGNISHQNQTVTITSQPLPTADPLQTFCVQQNATVNEIQITGQNIKWYSNLTGGTLVPTTTVAQDKATYYASQTINGCESERTPVTINIQVTFPPTGDINQLFCSGQNPAIADIQVTGTSIKWYDAVSNGSLLAETINLVNGQTYYVSQTVNNCESQRIGITVSIINTPPAPTGTASQSFCKNENATLNNIQITGQNIKWYDTNFSAATLPGTTLLEDNRTYYASQTIGCEGDRIPILVRIYDTARPVGKNNEIFCIAENATINDLSISGTALKWYDAATNGNVLATTTLLQNGNYYVSQTLNNCESDRFTIAVTILDTQMPIADSPQKFCIQQNASIEKIKIEGQNIKWYDALTGGMNLSESTPLENGITYYASQIINNCESERARITIQVLAATTPDCINYVDELPFPKFFTPNNDGHNDTWTIDFDYLAPNSTIRIFDRYGKFIKELSKNTEWDGTYIGHQEPSSDYWFVVTRLNGTDFRGHFSLKR